MEKWKSWMKEHLRQLDWSETVEIERHSSQLCRKPLVQIHRYLQK